MVDFTPEQRATIVRAVRAGRRALVGHPADPGRFFRAFAEAEGIQAPGRPLTGYEYARLRSLIGVGFYERQKWTGDDELDDVMMRELNRAHSETNWVISAGVDSVVAMRLVTEGTTADDACAVVAETDFEGLGPGLYGIHSIVVLPPCCDRSYFVTVFSDELPTVLTEQAPPSEWLQQPPKREPTRADWKAPSTATRDILIGGIWLAVALFAMALMYLSWH